MKHTGIKHILVGALGLVLLAACTQERPYKEDSKVDLNLKAKSELCTDEEYLYLPSTVETSRTTTATRPHWMGEAKVVKLKCNEHSLDVVEVELEQRFGDNPTNSLPVLSIPIEHIDYKCSEDADGRCTQVEERNKDISWKDRRFVDFQADKMKVQEVNWLPEQLTNLFYPCYTPTGEQLVSSKVESDAINIVLEKSFQTSVACAGPLRDLKDLGFRVRYHYSLVKLDRLSSEDYKPFKYTRADETTFGYFDTKTSKLDVDNNETVSGETAFLNRWNPNQTLVYKMNQEFNKPENRSLIAHTQKAVETVNKSLAQSGANLRIQLEMGDEELQTGDLRVNSIVLEDDPLAMGVIGYGPSAANPRTGEIVHARTVMYLGSIRKYVKVSYDEFVAKKLAAASAPKGTNPDVDKQVEITAQLIQQGRQSLERHTHRHIHEQAHPNRASTETKNISSGPIGRLPINRSLLKDHALNPLKNSMSRTDFARNPEDLIFSKNCFYMDDMIGEDQKLVEAIEQLVEEFELRPWSDLNEDQKTKALELLVPFVWTPVLVHELGHNLGLRHNFAGSEDKDNFYTEEELKDLGYSRPFKYSSVMDYSYSTINELPVMGKYDIAALMFAYAEKIETDSGEIMDLDQFRQDGTRKAKEYKYCTDEHVSVNPNCNRFDEGTTFVEMAEHHIRAYKEGYERHNLRNGRAQFSMLDDQAYIGRLSRTMGSLRRIFERYESLKHMFGLADNAKEWEEIDFLKDLKTATKMSAQFLISVVQTPDLLCAIAEASNPTSIRYLVPIQMISVNGVSCFDQSSVQLPGGLVMVGTAGKLVQSKKDPRSNNPYMDQIDVRGIWIDKLVALKTLLDRKTNNTLFDKYHDNFLDIADIGPAIDLALREIALNQSVAPVEIQTVFGVNLTVNFPINMFDSTERMNGHRILDPLDDGVNKLLGLPTGNPNFHEVLFGYLKDKLPSRSQINTDGSLLNSVHLVALAPGQKVDPSQHLSTKIGQQVYASSVGSQISNMLVVGFDVTKVLEAVTEERLTQLLALLKSGAEAPKDLSPAEKSAWDMGAEIIEVYLSGALQSSEFYSEAIRSLAQ